MSEKISFSHGQSTLLGADVVLHCEYVQYGTSPGHHPDITPIQPVLGQLYTGTIEIRIQAADKLNFSLPL